MGNKKRPVDMYLDSLPVGHSTVASMYGEYQPEACRHEWVKYVGLRETYYFCKLCDEKKPLDKDESYED